MIDINDCVEVTLSHPSKFLQVRESLTRIGLQHPSRKELFQSCHILHRRGRYYIVHFKELFALDGKEVDITANDVARRNTIALLLNRWQLCSVIDEEKIKSNVVPRDQIIVVPFANKAEWTLTTKYSMRTKKENESV